MEENGNQECYVWNGTADTSERKGDSECMKALELVNDSSCPVSDYSEGHSLPLPERLVNEEETIERTYCCEDEHIEELTDLLRNHYVETNGNDSTKVEMEDMAVKEEIDPMCTSTKTCNGNVSQTIESNHIEVILVEKEENITFEKVCGNGESMCELEYPEVKCVAHAMKTNELSNNFIHSEITDFDKKIEDRDLEREAQKGCNIVDIKPRVVSIEDQKTCYLCMQQNTKENNKSLSIASKDLDTEIMGTANIQESSCNICALKSNNKRKFCDSERPNEEKIGTDLLRSPSSISDKSSNSNFSGNSETKRKNKKEFSLETDPAVLSRRQKQIEYGKNTTGYQRYKKMIPKDQRSRQDPQTPPKCVKYSRRAWDGLIKTWRRKLHNWDPPKAEESDDDIISLVSTSSFPTLSDDSENLNDTLPDLVVEEQSLAVEMETDGISKNKEANSRQTQET